MKSAWRPLVDSDSTTNSLYTINENRRTCHDKDCDLELIAEVLWTVHYWQFFGDARLEWARMLHRFLASWREPSLLSPGSTFDWLTKSWRYSISRCHYINARPGSRSAPYSKYNMDIFSLDLILAWLHLVASSTIARMCPWGIASIQSVRVLWCPQLMWCKQAKYYLHIVTTDALDWAAAYLRCIVRPSKVHPWVHRSEQSCKACLANLSRWSVDW